MNRKGFTLIELLVCVCIAAIVIVLIVAALGGATSNENATPAPVLPNRLSVVSQEIRVNYQTVRIIRDSETKQEFILVTESESTAICPIPRE